MQPLERQQLPHAKLAKNAKKTIESGLTIPDLTLAFLCALRELGERRMITVVSVALFAT